MDSLCRCFPLVLEIFITALGSTISPMVPTPHSVRQATSYTQHSVVIVIEEDSAAGPGLFDAADGSVRYEGEWNAGLYHGEGTWSDHLGACQGFSCWSSLTLIPMAGNMYEGSYDSGLRHGRGKLSTADGSVYEGE